MVAKKLKILVFSQFYLPGYKGGGPIKTIKQLFDCAGETLLFKLVTSDRDLGDTQPYADVRTAVWNKVGSAQVFYAQQDLIGWWKIVRIFFDERHDIIYLNSFFSVRFSFIPLLLARLFGIKVVLGPRGEFSEGALSISLKKKRVYILLYKFFCLHLKTVFQASSDFEAADIRRVLGQNVDVQVAEDIGGIDFIEAIPARASGMRRAVFLSRVSPKKNLLGALSMLRAVQNPLIYHIYGPIEDLDYWGQCETLINSLPSHILVEYKGSLNPQDVVNTISEYDFFFMPTQGENYGHVIAEALCAGLPLLIANTTPWRGLQDKKIGWDLALSDPAAFSEVIDQLAIMPLSELLHMRETVLAWASKKFSNRDSIDANIAMFHYTYGKK
ncbi:glycosyltransferase [Zhongshania sp.]|uniref:glycosyltransferase n=1 Tax=Zhongshania sp. TaxID=1971902 RepID=UPI003565780B